MKKVIGNKGSASLEAAIIIPFVLVMIFIVVGAMSLAVQSGAFELRGNLKAIGHDGSLNPIESILHLGGTPEVFSEQIQVPFWGERTLKHRKVVFSQSLYDVIQYALTMQSYLNVSKDGKP